MKKVPWVLLLVAIATVAALLLPVAGEAVDYSIQITEVSVLGCGPDTPVYMAGTTVYGRDPDQKCTRLFDKPESQGFFNQPAIATWCDRRTSWNFTKQYNPGDYVLKAYVTSSGFFNQAFQTMTFSVPVCDACTP